MPDFEVALALVLKAEGGKSDNPKDPGGRTNQGITQKTYDAWRRTKGETTRSVYLISADEVMAIYRKQYADAICFDELPDGLGYAVFDAAVNSGPVEAAKWLQKTLGVDVDGHIGVGTLAAARDCDVAVAITNFCAARLKFLHLLPAWQTFHRGWSSRLAEVQKTALLMAAKPDAIAVGAPPIPSPGPVTLPSVVTPAPKPQPSAWQRWWEAIVGRAA